MIDRIKSQQRKTPLKYCKPTDEKTHVHIPIGIYTDDNYGRQIRQCF